MSYYGKLNGLTVDRLASETGLRYSDSGLLPVQLSVLGSRHGLPLKVNVATTEDDLRREIDKGRPVVALVAYRYILGRLDQADKIPGNDGHYLAVVGYDDTHFVLNDPDYRVPYVSRGHNTLVPVTELARAMAAYRGQCIFVGDVVMSVKEQVKALLAQASALVDTINETTTPAAPITKYATVNGLNIRDGDGTTYPILGKLAYGESVRVVKTSGQWDEIDLPIAGHVYNGSLSTTRPPAPNP